MKRFLSAGALAVIVGLLVACGPVNKVLDATTGIFSDDVNGLVSDARDAADSGKKFVDKAKADAGAVSGSDVGALFDEAKALFDAAKAKVDEAKATYDASK